MNYRNVFRIFKLERELGEDETAFLNSLRQMNDTECELLVESLSPSRKKTWKSANAVRCKAKLLDDKTCQMVKSHGIHALNCSDVSAHKFLPDLKSAGRSRRATELSDTLRQRAAGKATTATTSDDPNEHCRKEFPGGIVCDEPADANVHHLRGATGYHPFVSGAPHAAGKSSPNGEDGSSTVNSEAGKENVSTATGD